MEEAIKTQKQQLDVVAKGLGLPTLAELLDPEGDIGDEVNEDKGKENLI